MLDFLAIGVYVTSFVYLYLNQWCKDDIYNKDIIDKTDLKRSNNDILCDEMGLDIMNVDGMKTLWSLTNNKVP